MLWLPGLKIDCVIMPNRLLTFRRQSDLSIAIARGIGTRGRIYVLCIPMVNPVLGSPCSGLSGLWQTWWLDGLPVGGVRVSQKAVFGLGI